jgi:bacterioferritin (cytochrome b1)
LQQKTALWLLLNVGELPRDVRAAVRNHAGGHVIHSLLWYEDVVAERIAIDSYRDIFHYLDDKDPTTRRMLEPDLAAEEEHADELAGLLQDVPFGLMAKPLVAVKSA